MRIAKQLKTVQRALSPCIAVLAISAWPDTAAACRCQQQSLGEYYRSADIVFLADIVSMATITPEDGGSGFRTAQPRIIEDIKGASGVRHVRTPASSAACGIAIKPGERYWVFAQARPGEPVAWIDTCNGSRRADQGFEDTNAGEVAPRLRELAAADAQRDAPAPFTAPACWDHPRRYHTGAPPPEVAQKISVEQIDKPGNELDGAASPNGAYVLEVRNPTKIQRPPRVADVTVDIEREYLLRLRLHGVVEPVDATWINEKLIFVRASWDTRLATDLILDVEEERLIYSEAAWSGDDLFPGEGGHCPSE